MTTHGSSRFLAALKGERQDRVPYFFRDLTLSLDEGGFSTPEVCARRYDADKAFRSVMALQGRLHQDAVVGCVHHVGLDTELLGGAVNYPEYGIPSIIKHPLQDTNDPVLTLVDLDRDGPFPEVMRCYAMVSDALKGSAANVCNAEGPLTKAALLRGLETLIMDAHLEPELFGDLVRYATSSIREYISKVVEAGADCIFIAAASDNTDIFGPGPVIDQTIPGLNRLTKTAKEVGVPIIFHPHGDLGAERNTDYLDGILASQVDGIQFAEDNDTASFMQKVGERASILGGVDVASVLLVGPDRRISSETDRYLEMFKERPDYVFMCSCSLHRGLPLENVDVMVRALRAGPTN